MSAVKKPGWRVLLLLLICGIVFLVWFTLKTYLPVSPLQPYFPAEVTRLPQLHWLFVRFQPVFLYPFARGDSGFLRVVYRDPGGQIRMLDVYVGPVKPASSLLGVAINDQPNQISKISDYWRYLRPGDRISLTYLRAVTPRPGTGAADAVLPSSAQGQEVCAKLSAFCLPARLAETTPDPFWDFAVTGNFPARSLFPAVGLTTGLADQ